MRADLGFLREDDRFTVDVPRGLHLEPELVTTVAFCDVARQLTYVPEALHPAPDSVGEWRLVDRGSHQRVPVAIYRHLITPPNLIIVWRLLRGYLMTYVEEQEVGVGGARTIIRSLGVTGADTSMPKITLGSSLAPGNPREPDHLDKANFHPVPGATEPSSSVSFVRERRESAGNATRRPPGRIEASVTTSAGVRVSVAGLPDREEELKGLAMDVAKSIRQR